MYLTDINYSGCVSFVYAYTLLKWGTFSCSALLQSLLPSWVNVLIIPNLRASRLRQRLVFLRMNVAD